MPLSEVEGQPRAIDALEKALASKAIHHAWLFHGPDGVGKELAARALAQALTCREKPYEGCGTCSSCKRVVTRNHPDVTWIMPEDELVRRGLAGRSDFDHVPSRDIRIEQIRKLQERLAFRALEAPHKVALIISAHAMNVPAQNALLKTLEEPPRDTFLLLVTSGVDRLLATIRSRCAKAPFGPLSDELVAKKLVATKKVDPTLAAQVAAMASGSLARALELDVETLAQRKELLERFEALVPTDARGWLLLAESLAEERSQAEAAIELLSTWTRDVAIAQSGGEHLVNADLEPLARAAAQKVSPAALQRRLSMLERARVAIGQRNGSPRLQLERLFIELHSA